MMKPSGADLNQSPGNLWSALISSQGKLQHTKILTTRKSGNTCIILRQQSSNPKGLTLSLAS